MSCAPSHAFPRDVTRFFSLLSRVTTLLLWITFLAHNLVPRVLLPQSQRSGRATALGAFLSPERAIHLDSAKDRGTSNTVCSRFSNSLSSLANMIGWKLQNEYSEHAYKLGTTRDLDPWRSANGSLTLRASTSWAVQNWKPGIPDSSLIVRVHRGL